VVGLDLGLVGVFGVLGPLELNCHIIFKYC